jgi:thioredoxin-dependent peroxiredoxin
MATTKFKGNMVNIIGELPAIGTKAPGFILVKNDLSDVKLEGFAGKRLILNIFPSLDTSVCATSVRRFNVEAAKLTNTAVLCVSKDLPFAHGRFCSTEGIQNVITGSEFRSNSFGKAYGVMMTDGPLRGLMARSVVVLDENGTVLYNELVPEITQEPDYDSALASLK